MTARDGQPEEFRPTWAQTWQTSIKPFMTANVIAIVLMWVIGYMLAGPVLSVVLPLVVAGVVVGLARYASRSRVARLSPYGVEFVGRGGRITRMRWTDVQQVAVLAPKTGAVIAPYGVGRAALSGDMAAFAHANTGPGLVGRGEVLTRQQAQQQRGQGPTWLTFGVPDKQVRLFLTTIDRDWPGGAMGDWVRRYRPDLLPPVPYTAQRG